MDRKKPDIIGKTEGLIASAEQARVKLTPEIERLLREGAERVQSKVLAHEKLTKADLAFIGEAKKMIEGERFIQLTLKPRFESHPERHAGIGWPEVENSLRADPEALPSLLKLEEAGGEPEVVGIEGGELIFEDRSVESPSGRRNLNFDEADAQRRSFGPNVRFQSPDSYRTMQKTGKFDLESWSWLETDAKTREAGSAVYGARYGENMGVDGYNADIRNPRGGWRASLRVKKA
jgi:hypothetical protein